MKALLLQINKYLEDFDLSIFNITKVKEPGFYLNGSVYTKDNVLLFNEINHDNFCLLNKPNNDEKPLFLAACFVSKMVYDNFYLNNDKRLPNDLYAIDYPMNYLNFDYMRYERELLLKANKQNNNYEKISYFRMFLNVRELRSQLLEEGFSNQEYRLETITGLSYYAMIIFMRKYNKTLAKKYIKEILSNFTKVSLNHFDFRTANINSGLLQLLVLDELNYRVMDLFKNDITIFKFAISKIEFIKEPISFINDVPLIDNIKNYMEEVQSIFSNFFLRDPIRITGQFKLIGFNPNTIIRNKNNIFHADFIVVEDLKKKKIIQYDGPVVTKIKEGSYNIVTCIYKY